MTGKSIFKFLFLILIPLLVTLKPSQAASNDTVVLIHGFSGWGRDEMAGFKYWGGFNDIEANLKQQGVPTVTVAVGPFSSNWDRAVEAYYQLKGGCVDYGKAHALKHNHKQFGRCYKPLLTNWDSNSRINIIAHSQGGQTARVLAQLLNNGAINEVLASGNNTSALFTGGKSWIRSMTTISSPHRGTTLTKANNLILNYANNVLQAVATAKTLAVNNLIYDFKMDQWDLTKQPNESLTNYLNRVMQSKVLTDNTNTDNAIYDLSPEGAEALNKWVTDSSDIYYFSLSTDSSWSLITGIAYPTPLTSLVLQPITLWLGTYRNVAPQVGEIYIDQTWAHNDGVNNTISMKAPSNASVVEFNANTMVPTKGTWQHLGTLQDWDHMDIVGWTTVMNPLDFKNPTDFYMNLGKYVHSLR